jgi:hypothetical protein
MDEIDEIINHYSTPQADVMSSAAPDEIDSIIAQYSGTPVSHEEPTFNWPRFGGEQVAKGVLSYGDLIQEIGKDLPKPTSRNPEVQGGLNQFFSPKVKGRPSELIEETIHPTTPLQRIGGKAARFIGSSAVPFPGMGLGSVAKSALVGGTSGGASGFLQEMGVPSPYADIAGMVGAASAAPLGRTALSYVFPKMSPHEVSAGTHLQKMIGPKNLPEVKKRLENVTPPMEGYNPTTAEVAQHPTFSQLQAMQHGVTGSGISEHLGESHDVMMNSLEKARGPHAPIRGEQVQEKLIGELNKRKTVRREATEPLYEKIQKMDEPLNPKNLRNFLKNTVVKGDLEKDLNAIKKDIRPTSKLSKEEDAYRKLYKNANERIKSQMKPPNGNYPTVAELSAVRTSINAKLEKFSKSGQKARYTVLKRAAQALDKDLESIPLQKEVTAKYRELSKPVSEIEKQPTLKSILKDASNGVGKSTNVITRKIFDKHAEENIAALKNAFKDDPETLENLRSLGVHHFMEFIKNAGAEGSGNVLSSDKMNNFMKSYGKAMHDLLTPDQMKVIKQTEMALQARNRAETLGRGPGSPTAPRLQSEFLARKGLSGFLAHHFLKVGAGTPLVKEYAKSAIKNREDQMIDLLNKALLDPKLAHKLVSTDFKNQQEFTKFINTINRQAIPTAAQISSKRSEND